MNATTYRVHSDNNRSDRLLRQKRTRSGTMMMTGGMSLSSVLLLSAALLFCQVQAWGNSNNNNNGATTYSIYGNGFTRDWLYDSTSLAIQVEGCAWGLVEDSEEVGCLQDESEDGTTNWYMMANCRRPQVVYSVYASSSGSASCNSDYFVGSFITTIGVSEFIGYLATYDPNFSYNADDGYGYDALPECYQGDNGYLGLDCSDGMFTLAYYDDQYCMARTGNTADSLNGVNNLMSSYESCTSVYLNNDDANGGGNNQGSLISSLIYYSSPCTSYDYSLCKDYYNFEERSNGVSRVNGLSASSFSNAAAGGHQSWVTKLKYVIGGLFLLASFIMFTGILFTNRRRRRAMMMRKYRQAKKAKKDKGRDSGSRKSRSDSKRRSKSKSRSKESDGVFT